MKKAIGNEAQEFNEGHILEGADRCHTITVMLDELLNEHPAVLKAGVQDKLEKAQRLMVDMYAEIWALEESL